MAKSVEKKNGSKSKSPAPAVRDPFLTFRDEMNDLFDRAFGRSLSLFDSPKFPEFSKSMEADLSPRIDIHESDQAITLTAELPGIEEKEIDLAIHDGVLTLKGEKKYEKEDKKDDAVHIERHYGSFQRSFTLPSTVREEDVEANYENGVLTIKMPKSEPSKPKGRTIKIGK